MKTNVGMPGHAVRILAMFELDKREGMRQGRIVLVESWDPGQYVVSSQYGDNPPLSEMAEAVGRDWDVEWDRSWDQGHYFDDLEEARDYFLKRCEER